ncbi:exo-alpha-sialidase [Microbacterium sp. NPDC058342]|uniref:exo-alpha-sialidase n=1 Tax=Microbacterium sp. NPDC058342 TaxID=3346454 RepID=UPI00365E7268
MSTSPVILDRPTVQMLAPDVKNALNEYHWRRNFQLFECLMTDSDHGTKGADPAIIPYIRDARRAIVYYGNEFHGSYNHHNQIAKFRGRYYYAWSNGFRNEEDAGQKVLIADSDDALNWSDPRIVLDVEEGSQWANNCVAMHATDDFLYVVIMSEETEHDETVTGMRRIRPDNAYMDVYRSADGISFEKAFSYGSTIKWIFEAPRLTAEGRLLCVCTTMDGVPAILLWPGDDILAEPEFIRVEPPQGASFPYGESTWYQLDDGRIVVFWRDEGASCYAYVNFSEDGGRTWTQPMITDIPDSMSRLYAGRLTDGRYYLVNNAIPTLLDRMPLTLMLSDDGLTFDKVYMINDSPVEMRRKGLLKINGHQYPCCLVDGDKLIVAYDANKEDIMCEVIETAGL